MSAALLFYLLFSNCLLRFLGRFLVDLDAVRFVLESAAALTAAAFVPLANFHSSFMLESSFSVFMANNGSKLLPLIW